MASQCKSHAKHGPQGKGRECTGYKACSMRSVQPAERVKTHAFVYLHASERASEGCPFSQDYYHHINFVHTVWFGRSKASATLKPVMDRKVSYNSSYVMDGKISYDEPSRTFFYFLLLFGFSVLNPKYSFWGFLDAADPGSIFLFEPKLCSSLAGIVNCIRSSVML